MINNYYYYEQKYSINKKSVILGLDEAGRGCWAGPLVVAGCIFPKDYKNDRIKDSKQLSTKVREELFDQIIKDAISYKIVFVSPKEVDELNPKQASIKAMTEIANFINPSPSMVLVDAEKLPNCKHKTISIIKGDSKSISIAAASILAKVSRDRYMIQMQKKYPQFSFEKHKGYGTLMHLKELKQNGPIVDFHRYSYKPVMKWNKSNNI